MQKCAAVGIAAPVAVAVAVLQAYYALYAIHYMNTLEFIVHHSTSRAISSPKHSNAISCFEFYICLHVNDLHRAFILFFVLFHCTVSRSLPLPHSTLHTHTHTHIYLFNREFIALYAMINFMLYALCACTVCTLNQA